MRIFVFGIGGTGARTLRALTMLMAAGVKLNHQDLSVVPIIIDTDANNGDTARTRGLLRSYYDIRNNYIGKTVTSQSDSFFNTRIQSFDPSHRNKDNPEVADLEVQFNIHNQDQTFRNFISFNALADENKAIMELFYHDSLDDHPELDLNLNVGFKGNPNIGCVVFNSLVNSQQFKDFERSFAADDRVFIISSIFGGTGASGFPTLVKLIRKSSNNNLNTARIGAITVMPYFNVAANDKSAINSALFNTKTKSALAFYADDEHINSINALYYIADKNQSALYKNVEGGVGQVNNGHLIELLSATAVVDFINKTNDQLKKPQHLEYGAVSDKNPFTIAQFEQRTKESCITPLIRFAYAAKIATQFIPTLSGEAFYKSLNVAGKLGIQTGYDTLLSFFEQFKTWTGTELNNVNNGRVFTSFNFDESDDLNNLVQDMPVKTKIFSSNKLSKQHISAQLDRNQNAEASSTAKPVQYMDTLYKTTTTCLKELGKLP